MAYVTFYNKDPNAPRPNMPAHLGSNCIITCGGKLLLEKRVDSDTWGLVGGGCKKWEEPNQAMAREVYEELGWRVKPAEFKKVKNLASFDSLLMRMGRSSDTSRKNTTMTIRQMLPSRKAAMRPGSP